MEEYLKLNMNDYLPLRDVVFNTLRQAILKGELEPGERLMEVTLANKLGVSRTPVREAIRKLELEGLVLMIPRRGAEVASISEKNMMDVLEVREGLENLALELACQRITPDQIIELKRANVNFENTLSQGDVIAIAEADEHFHELIYKASGNEKLVQVINNIKEQMYRYRLEYIKDAKGRQRLVSEHKEIVGSLERKDLESAKRVMHVHLENQEETVKKNIQAVKK
ncbi:MAG: GntR family transcriptional regulator [Lachnospiraceae bacterium]|nr:GntR family transcriptional regulator [Lachnospiraceae bacterium]